MIQIKELRWFNNTSGSIVNCEMCKDGVAEYLGKQVDGVTQGLIFLCKECAVLEGI